MEIQEFTRILAAKQRELDTLMRRKLPVQVGNMAKTHYQENFRQGGFVNDGLHKWPDAKEGCPVQIRSSQLQNPAKQQEPFIQQHEVYSG